MLLQGQQILSHQSLKKTKNKKQKTKQKKQKTKNKTKKTKNKKQKQNKMCIVGKSCVQSSIIIIIIIIIEIKSIWMSYNIIAIPISIDGCRGKGPKFMHTGPWAYESPNW